MPLITEDGTNVNGSESYITVINADTYFSERGDTLWGSMTTVQKEQALRRATEFMVGRYRSRWKGSRSHFNQSLDWPRQGVLLDVLRQGPGYYGAYIDYNVIPKDIQRACAQLALRAAAGPLVEDQEQKVIQETIGPITTKYDPNGTAEIKYTQVDEMLGVYLARSTGGAVYKLSRA